eukprot:908912-Pelagomonas_calceolata.AAC.7
MPTRHREREQEERGGGYSGSRAAAPVPRRSVAGSTCWSACRVVSPFAFASSHCVHWEDLPGREGARPLFRSRLPEVSHRRAQSLCLCKCTPLSSEQGSRSASYGQEVNMDSPNRA